MGGCRPRPAPWAVPGPGSVPGQVVGRLPLTAAVGALHAPWAVPGPGSVPGQVVGRLPACPKQRHS